MGHQGPLYSDQESSDHRHIGKGDRFSKKTVLKAFERVDSLIKPHQMGGRFKKEGLHVYLCLTHVEV